MKLTNFTRRNKNNNMGGGVQCSTTHKSWTALMYINGTLIAKKFSVQKIMKKDIIQNVYDPRIKKSIYSDNPALILANIIINSELISPNEEFWKTVVILADYCDTRI